MNTPLVKICGLTREEDVKSAVSCGADAIGFVFAKSPRRVTPSVAARLAACVPPGILRVGLFLDQDQADIENVLASVLLDLLQFHGRESEQQCRVYGVPWLKALSMANEGALRLAERDHPGAKGWLLDSHQAGQRGGSGEVFDWSLVQAVDKPIWLAGGLTAANVGEAIGIVRPYAVDVSSGVESAPGIKDAARISAFIEAVRKTVSNVAGNEGYE